MIHPTAVIDPRASIDESADIGPYVVVAGPVVVGAHTRLMAHATVVGATTLGTDNVVYNGATIGQEPQDLAFSGQESFLRIGHRNVFREHVTVHRGTQPGTSTVIGDDNYLMSNAHVGHNSHLGNRTILANGALLGGHVEVGDQVFISGNCVVHQFVRIGRLAFLRGLSRTSRDVPPFCMMDGTHTVRGLNRVGLRRAGFGSAEVRSLGRAFARLFGRRVNLRLAVAELAAESPTPEVVELLAFIRESRRGVCFGPRRSGDGEADE